MVAVVVSGVGVGLGGIKFCNSGNDGQLLVWWPALSHNAHGGEMRGGSGAVGSFVLLLPPAIAGGVGSMGVLRGTRGGGMESLRRGMSRRVGWVTG